MPQTKVEILSQKDLTTEQIKKALSTSRPDNPILGVYQIDKKADSLRRLFNRFLWYVVFLALVGYLAYFWGREYCEVNKLFPVHLFRYDSEKDTFTPLGSTMVSQKNNRIAIREEALDKSAGETRGERTIRKLKKGEIEGEVLK